MIPFSNLRSRLNLHAFTLLEVVFAIGIFFTAVFFILQLTTQQLKAAKTLQSLDMDIRLLPSLITMTNQLYEGPLPPEIKMAFEHLANGEYKNRQREGFSCDGEVFPYVTNGMFQINYVVRWQQNGRLKESRNSLLLWRPERGRRIQSQ